MADVTLATFDEMEPIYDGVARRARDARGDSVGHAAIRAPAALGRLSGSRARRHGRGREPGGGLHPVGGSAELWAGEERFALRPGVMVRVGPEQRRRIVPGDAGIRFIALGGVPGTFRHSPWTEIGGPWPVPQ